LKRFTHIVLLIIGLIAISACTNNKEPTSKKVLIESRTLKYRYVDGKLDSTGTLYERIIFDKQGKDSIIENYNDSGSLILRTVYTLIQQVIKLNLSITNLMET